MGVQVPRLTELSTSDRSDEIVLFVGTIKAEISRATAVSSRQTVLPETAEQHLWGGVSLGEARRVNAEGSSSRDDPFRPLRVNRSVRA